MSYNARLRTTTVNASVLALAAAMVVLGRAPVLTRGFAAASAQSRRSTKSGALYTVVDAASATNGSAEDTTPSDQDIARRRREYARAFAISAVIFNGGKIF